jgi:hypothetical protein
MSRVDLDAVQARLDKAGDVRHGFVLLPLEDAEDVVTELRAAREQMMVMATALQACRDPWYSADDHISPDGCPDPPCPACQRQEEEARELARIALAAYDQAITP